MLYGPSFVIVGHRRHVPTSARTFEEALAESGSGSSAGILAWKQKPEAAYIFDFPARIAVASLINQGYDPIFAAALTWHGIVCAMPTAESQAMPTAREYMQWGADRLHLRDGSDWTVLADNDIYATRPEHLDLAGLAVIPFEGGSSARVLRDAVSAAISSSQHPEHRP